MTTSALGTNRSGSAQDGAARPLVVTGAIAAGAAAGSGLAALTMLVLAGWIAAPHAGIGLTGVLRTAAALWLVGHHVGFTLHGAGRIGMLPLGLVLLPGALLWRAGRWVVTSGGVTRLRYVGYAALALAVPYALVAGALALASASQLAAPSAPQAVTAGFLLAFTAGGLGGARALAPWRQLAGLLSVRFRSVILGSTGTLAVLVAAGSVLAGASLAAHLGSFNSVNGELAPGIVGALLLVLAQLAYVPNAIIWAISFMLGPGFAFGAGSSPALGIRLRRAGRLRDRRAGCLRWRPAGRRTAVRGGAVRLAGCRSGHPRDGRRRRGNRRGGQLALIAPGCGCPCGRRRDGRGRWSHRRRSGGLWAGRPRWS